MSLHVLPHMWHVGSVGQEPGLGLSHAPWPPCSSWSIEGVSCPSGVSLSTAPHPCWHCPPSQALQSMPCGQLCALNPALCTQLTQCNHSLLPALQPEQAELCWTVPHCAELCCTVPCHAIGIELFYTVLSHAVPSSAMVLSSGGSC